MDQGHRIFSQKATKLNQNHKIIDLGKFYHHPIVFNHVDLIQWLFLSGKRNKLANVLAEKEKKILKYEIEHKICTTAVLEVSCYARQN